MSKNEVDPTYYNYFNGRPNIFILFIIKSLNLLNPNGILSFVLPKNFLNCLYYNKTRKYILNNFKIIDIILCDDDYIETKQDTIILIIQNKLVSDNERFTLINEDNVIFGTPEIIIQLKLLYENSTTLSKLNFSVNVGNIVWNQCKNQLTDDITKTLLIYSSDIRNNQLCIQDYSNEEKKNYIEREGLKEPLLVINRGYGVGKYKFEYCLIKGNIKYLIENHLICVKYNLTITNEELIDLYKRIINSFENEKTTQFIHLYFGNNAINTTELQNILPIYI
jgi:adenine-specific DNA-methyltransferase